MKISLFLNKGKWASERGTQMTAMRGCTRAAADWWHGTATSEPVMGLYMNYYQAISAHNMHVGPLQTKFIHQLQHKFIHLTIIANALILTNLYEIALKFLGWLMIDEIIRIRRIMSDYLIICEQGCMCIEYTELSPLI